MVGKERAEDLSALRSGLMVRATALLQAASHLIAQRFPEPAYSKLGDHVEVVGSFCEGFPGLQDRVDVGPVAQGVCTGDPDYRCAVILEVAFDRIFVQDWPELGIEPEHDLHGWRHLQRDIFCGSYSVVLPVSADDDGVYVDLLAG